MSDPAAVPATLNATDPDSMTVPQAAMAWTADESGSLTPKPRSAEARMRKALMRARDFLRDQCIDADGRSRGCGKPHPCAFCAEVRAIEEAIE